MTNSSSAQTIDMNGKKLLVFSLSGLIVSTLLSGSVISKENAGINRHRQVQAVTLPHQVHDKKLREIMLRLNALVSFSEQPGFPLSHESSEFLTELIDTAALVANSALQLKEDDANESPQFSTLAEQLYEQAVSIEMNARNMNLEEMNNSFSELNQTCISCHKLYRGL